MSKAKQLTDYLTQPRASFDWAGRNCCIWSARWVEVVEGFDPMAGMPSTEGLRAARRLIEQIGGDIVGIITERLSRQPIPPRMAQMGDIAFVPLEAPAFTVGICAGSTLMCITDDGSVLHVPLDAASHAWRIGAAA